MEAERLEGGERGRAMADRGLNNNTNGKLGAMVSSAVNSSYCVAGESFWCGGKGLKRWQRKEAARGRVRGSGGFPSRGRDPGTSETGGIRSCE
jgi:hypothetical protein